MSHMLGTAWTVSEKIVLLTNIIQDVGHDVPSLLLQAIAERDIQPRWTEIPLPAGRSLSACQKIYQEMLHVSPVQPRSVSAIIPATYAPQPLGPSFTPVRAVSEHEVRVPPHRLIRPRPTRVSDTSLPPVTNGDTFTILPPAGYETGAERPKKRGRPTKEEAEERDRRLAATGRTYEPKKRAPKKARLSGTPGSFSDPRPATSPGLQTPLSQHPDHSEKASTGLRQTRQQPAEEEASHHPVPQSPLDDSGNERSTDAAQSPSDRLLLRSAERAQAVASVARNIAQAQSPRTWQEAESDQRHESQHRGRSAI